MVKRKNKRGNVGSGQSLTHVATVVANATASNYLAQTTFGVIANRPARPHSVSVQYVSASPGRTFTVLFYGANQEIIHRSPVLLTGIVPRVYRAVMPRNTDYSIWNATDVFCTINTVVVSGNQITCAFNAKMIYKNPSPVNYV